MKCVCFSIRDRVEWCVRCEPVPIRQLKPEGLILIECDGGVQRSKCNQNGLIEQVDLIEGGDSNRVQNLGGAERSAFSNFDFEWTFWGAGLKKLNACQVGC